MKSDKKELLIFDFFGVICGEIAPFVFANHFDKETAEKLKQEFFVPADLGKTPMDEVFDGMAKLMGVSLPELKKEWDSYIILNEDVVKFAKKLREKYAVALLSNAPVGVVEELMDRFGLHGLFDTETISSKVGLVKPDPEIYKLCLNTFENKFEKIYMVDDNASNLAPLPALGITPIKFETLDDLMKVFG